MAPFKYSEGRKAVYESSNEVEMASVGMQVRQVGLGLLGICSVGMGGLGNWAAIANPAPLLTPSSIPLKEQVETVVSRLMGTMDTSEQAASQEGAPHVQLTTCDVQLEGEDEELLTDGIILYQEQAMADRLSQPYRQRFLWVVPSDDGLAIESRTYRPLVPETWIGLCDRPLAQRTVTSDAMEDAHCRVFLRPVGEDYIGNTQPGGCPTNYRSAVRITNRIVLRPTGMDTLDRGLDIEGNQVWGSGGIPYQFRRSSTEAVLSH